MKFSEVPTLAKFEKHALANPSCAITQYCYKAVADVISSVESLQGSSYNLHETTALLNLKDRCVAMEKSTRIIWACAAATDHVVPRKWEYIPDFESALNYFQSLGDIELMAETKDHRISWEQKIRV